MPDKTSDTIIAAILEQLVAEGPQAMAQVVTVLMNLAMRMNREQFLGAAHYERAPFAPDRKGPLPVILTTAFSFFRVPSR
jgi:hypothetical protein